MVKLADVRDYVRDYVEAEESELGERWLGVLVSVGAVLSVAGVLAVTWVAGWRQVWRSVQHAQWPFLVIAPLAVVISHLGYALAYRAVADADGGPTLAARDAVIIVTTGFGPVSPRGGFVLDAEQFRRHGLSREQARLRVRVVGLLEYAVLAPATFAAAVYMSVRGLTAQSGLLPSWIVGVPVGAAITVALTAWFRRAGRPASWWNPLRHFLTAIERLFDLVRTWPAGGFAFAGMALYWAAEIVALGGWLDVFAHRRGDLAVVIVGYATGYALTRRTLPLGAAGVVEALLPFGLSWVGFPLASAVPAVVGYRLCNLWLAVLPAVLGLRRLRRDQGGRTRRVP